MIQPRGDRALSLGDGLGYYAQPFHLGWLYTEPVTLNSVADGVEAPITFSADDFEYRDPTVGKLAAAEALPGVAGFRLSYPMNASDRLSEIVAFLGASYFRALGRDNVYGASARGVVINSWVAEPEEFPRFSAYYIERTATGEPLAVYAELDGPSLTGAFRFTFDPATPERQDSVVDVTAHFFFREDITEMGVAPLTSMFLFSAANRHRFDDYRPRVHDSDGLWMKADTGEVSWRPLNNPQQLANSYFAQRAPVAFGLMQRARGFDSYEDAGARYDLRPSVVVEPQGDWGEGALRLVEIPAQLEADDNVVAFWIPKTPFKAGNSAEISYRMRWGDLPPDGTDLAFVADTSAGQGGVSGVDNVQSLRKFVVDFKGAPLLPEHIGSWPVDAVANISGGKVLFTAVSRLPESDMMRLVIDAEINSTDPVELRAFLVGSGRQLTETWLYQWRADT